MARWLLMGLMAALLCGLGCAGEISVNIPGCEDCPDRCLRGQGEGGTCVDCLDDTHCQSKTSPTRKCILNKCNCGTDQDCPQGEVCAGSKGCVECRQNSDCTIPEKPICGEDMHCYECKPKALEACVPDGAKVCTPGTRQCKGSGRWGTCEGFKRCGADERCVDQLCVPNKLPPTCPSTPPCVFGERRCVTKGQATPGRYQRCVPDKDGCPSWAQEFGDCLNDEYCDAGTCVKAPSQTCDAPTPTLCGDTCVNTDNDTAHCGSCGNKCPDGQRCASGQCVTSCPSSAPLCGSGPSGTCCSQDCCQGTCTDLQRDKRHCGTCGNVCPPSLVCDSGQCLCPNGAELCGTSCVDLTSDPKHCGKCGDACGTGQSCQQGKCVCPSGELCGGSCVDLKSDTTHCGACGNACPAGAPCVSGTCQCPVDRALCGGGCVDLLTHPKHCGRCGRACSSGQVCAGGRCVVSCPKGTPDACFGGCFNTTFSIQHCGRCGNPCQAGESCVGGRCECPPGQLRCSGACIDTMAHRSHCGGCGRACPGGQVCARGRCVASCAKAAPTSCFGACVDTQRSDDHCGACGKACHRLERCEKGTCVCPAGMIRCQGLCVDPKSHRLHCGACGKVCPDSQICSNGTCVATCPTHVPSLCNGGCTQPGENTLHCGACGNACYPGFRCDKGSCACPPGFEACLNKCINVFSDPLHCGGCGKNCPPDEFCVQGTCSKTPAPQETGWTTLAKTPDTKVYYVSASTGKDTNDGLTPGTALKTLAKGVAKLREGKPDWLLLKRGDTWSESFKGWRKSGASATAMMVVASYGSGARPLLQTGADNCLTAYHYSGRPPLQFVAFTGFHCRAHTRPNNTKVTGIMLHSSKSLLFEDLHIQGYSSAVYIDGSPSSGKMESITVRRCLMTDNTHGTASISTVLITTCKDILFEENILDNNGLISGAGEQLGTNGFSGRTCSGLVIRRNIITRAGTNAISVKEGAIEENLIFDAPIAFLISTSASALKIEKNVVMHGSQRKLSDGVTRNLGIYAAKAHTALTLNDNLFAHSTGPRRLYTLQSGNSFAGNIGYQWGSVTEPAGVSYVSPQRDLFSYLSAQGKSQDVKAFADELRLQTKGNWRAAWTPQALLSYFRGGFQKKP